MTTNTKDTPTIGNLSRLGALAKSVRGRNEQQGTLLRVPIDDLYSEEQVRKQFKNLEELGQTILDEGQINPITVAPKNSSGKYLIRKGERRWRAMKLKGIEYVDIVIDVRLRNLSDEIIGQVVENLQRDDLMPLEIADAISRLETAGLDKSQIASRFGKSLAWISAHRSLQSLPGQVLELYSAGIVQDTDTLNFLRKLEKTDASRFQKAIDAANTNHAFTRHEAKEAFEEAKAEKVEKEDQGGDPAAGTVVASEKTAKSKVALPENDSVQQRAPGKAQIRVAVGRQKGYLVLSLKDSSEEMAYVQFDNADEVQRVEVAKIRLLVVR